MSTIEKISIVPTPGLASLVRNADHASTNGVICETLHNWQNQQNLTAHKIRALWQEGLDSGTAGKLNMAAIKQMARQLSGT